MNEKAQPIITVFFNLRILALFHKSFCINMLCRHMRGHFGDTGRAAFSNSCAALSVGLDIHLSKSYRRPR